MSFILTIDLSNPTRYVWSSTHFSCYQKVPVAKVRPERVCATNLMSKKQLKTSLPRLKSQFPKISPVYHLAVNILQHGFKWPGMGMFTTDQSPNPYVVIYKPTGSSKKQSYKPMFQDCLRVFIWARSANVLQQTMEEDPKMLDWNMPIVFADLDLSFAWMFCRQKGIPGSFKIVAPESGWRTAEGRFWFDLQKTNFERLPYPKAFHMGRLSVQHLDHILAACDYSSLWRNVFSHMMSCGLPSAALFAGSESDTPVAYCMYMPHGCISAVYVHTNYQNLFRPVLVELLIRLKEMGYVSASMDTGSLFFPLQMEEVRGLGGKECKGQGTCWLKYTPQNSECPPEKGGRSRGLKNLIVRPVKPAREVEENLFVHNGAAFKYYEDRYDTVYRGSIKRTTRRRSYDAGGRIPGRSGRRKSLQGRNEHGFAGLQEDPYEFCEYEDMTVTQRQKR